MNENRTNFWLITLTILLCVGIISSVFVAYNVGYKYCEREAKDIDSLKESPQLQEFSAKGTGSMYPMINYANKENTMWVNPEDKIYCGQVYIFEKEDGSRTIHRLVYEDKAGNYVFKGDNNPIPDRPVNRSQIKEKLISLEFDQ